MLCKEVGVEWAKREPGTKPWGHQRSGDSVQRSLERLGASGAGEGKGKPRDGTAELRKGSVSGERQKLAAEGCREIR